MKIENESNNFLKGEPYLNVMLEARREKESVSINEIRSGQINKPPVHLMDEMSNAAAERSRIRQRSNQEL